jgi:hypothetical protein
MAIGTLLAATMYTRPDLGVLFCTIALLLLLGGIGSYSDLRRRGSNQKAIGGFLGVLGSWSILMAVMGMILFGWQPGYSEQPYWAFFLPIVTIVSMAVMITGWIIALLGVAEMHRNPNRYRHGRWRALGSVATALIAPVYLFYVFTTGFAEGFKRSAKGAEAAAHPQATVVDDFNYKIALPKGWSAAEPKKAKDNDSEEASANAVVLGRANPEIYCVIRSRHLLPASPVRVEDLSERAKAEIRVGGGHPNIITEEKISINGLDGIRLEYEITAANAPYFFVYWLARDQANSYRVVTWGTTAPRSTVREESAKLLSGFETIDKTKAPIASVDGSPQKHHSARYGWSIDFEGTWWTRPWEFPSLDVPSAEWGAINSTGTACFCVTPIWMGKKEADLDAITQSFLSRFGIPFPDPAVTGVRPWSDRSEPTLAGRTLSWAGQSHGRDFVYCFRIVRAPTCTYLLAAWLDKRVGGHPEDLEAALDKFKVDHLQPIEIVPEFFKRADAAAHRTIFHGIAVYYEQKQQAEEAEKWFRRAYEIDRSDPGILYQYVTLFAGNGHKEAARDYLEQESEHFPGNAKLVQARAQIRAIHLD